MLNLMNLNFCKRETSKKGSHLSFPGSALLLIQACLAFFTILNAQEETAPGKFRITLTDKNNNPFSIEKPGEFLSDRALLRRQKQNITIDYKDIPVTPAYIQEIISTGARILTVSKWFNAVTVDHADSSVLRLISDLSFVRSVSRKISSPLMPVQKAAIIESPIENSTISYGKSARQILIHKGEKLHEMGFTGTGMVIAVLDAGFEDVDKHEAFRTLWQENRILGSRDFVHPGSSVFGAYTHGKTVLSVIGGSIPGSLSGTAPDASFWLLRTEDGSTEYRIEEDNWIAAAEFADSAGVDIINTSLSYSVFDDPLQNYSYADMNGNKARISVAADIAASKGMLVIVSAGNEGRSTWGHITAPADADSALAVGAIDSTLAIASFSSHGPSYDGRVKPDVCAMGVKTFGVNAAGLLAGSNGTSFSAPVITGLAACLWQANPKAGAMDILKAIQESADRYLQPDTLYGYGIPDFLLAHNLLKTRFMPVDSVNPCTVFPNPFSSVIFLRLREPDASGLLITLCDPTGRTVYSSQLQTSENEYFLEACRDLSFLPQGIYFMNVKSDHWQYATSLVKL
jgi:subtilisin family serine protease